MALIPDDPRQRNALLGIIIALAAVYLFWDYWYNPQVEEIDALEARLEQVEEQNRQAQVIAARGGEELEERLAVYERHIERLEELIPESEEVPALLNSMALEARNAGVELGSMRPEPADEGEFYTMQSYEIGVIGDYHDVGRFLTAVASLPRIVTPVDVEITPYTGPDVTDAAFPVQARFRIQTYVVPGDGDLPPELPEESGA